MGAWMGLHDTNRALFGDFPGAELDVLACEALLNTRWPVADARREAELMRSKWWDYRLLHAVHATYFFAHILDAETRQIIRTYLDDAPARVATNGQVVDWHVIKAGDVFQPPVSPVPARQAYWKRKVTGLIRARQVADRDGIPYDLFCREGLRHYYLGAGTYVFDKRGGKVIEPNLLYNEACLLVIRGKWLEQMQMRVQHAAHPIYLVQNDDGHPDRLAHRLWLVEQLRCRPDGVARKNAIRRLVRAGLLPGAESIKAA